jgi:hypothetical protein
MRTAASMKKSTGKSARPTRAGTVRAFWPLLITGIAVILFSSAGIARLMWDADTAGYSGAILALDVPAGVARAGPRCPECGMIELVREIERHDEESTRSHEFVVRMADGSSRVIGDANPGRWRTSERLIVIDGTRPSRP